MVETKAMYYTVVFIFFGAFFLRHARVLFYPSPSEWPVPFFFGLTTIIRAFLICDIHRRKCGMVIIGRLSQDKRPKNVAFLLVRYGVTSAIGSNSRRGKWVYPPFRRRGLVVWAVCAQRKYLA